ncbi:MAG: LptF/LptG family permease [Flavobacteriales bacterium]|nr:LptF/LptG family permease [Flavobacteriales bacterium]
MKIIDRYIIRKFLGTFVFIILIFTVIAVVFDMSEKLKDFIKSDLGLFGVIYQYTQHFAMWIINLLSPFIIFLSAIWVCSRMASRSENIAILSGGHSFNRFLRPYVISAGFLVLFLLYMGHFVVPRSNFKKLQYENAYTNFESLKSQQYLELEKGTIVYYASFNIKSNQATRFSIKKFKPIDGKIVKYYDLQASTAEGDSSTGKWKIRDYFIREISADGETIRTGKKLDTTFSFKGPDLGRRAESVTAMGTYRLMEYRDAEADKGSGNVALAEVEIYTRTSTPFSVFILVILAVCISYKKKRNGIGLNLIIGLSIGAISFFISKITSVAATNAGLHPLMAVWVSNIIFGFITLIFYFKARR